MSIYFHLFIYNSRMMLNAFKQKGKVRKLINYKANELEKINYIFL